MMEQRRNISAGRYLHVFALPNTIRFLLFEETPSSFKPRLKETAQQVLP
jgi:hypothetical protein